MLRSYARPLQWNHPRWQSIDPKLGRTPNGWMSFVYKDSFIPSQNPLFTSNTSSSKASNNQQPRTQNKPSSITTYNLHLTINMHFSKTIAFTILAGFAAVNAAPNPSNGNSLLMAREAIDTVYNSPQRRCTTDYTGCSECKSSCLAGIVDTAGLTGCLLGCGSIYCDC